MPAKDARPPHVRAQDLKERRECLKAAKVFERLCKEGDADRLYDAARWLNEAGDVGWRIAFARVAKLSRVSTEVQHAFVPIWVEHKMLPLCVGDRPVCAAALRVLMPRNYSGELLLLFRGANAQERRRRLYGFSWSTDAGVARGFATHWGQSYPGGVLLKTLAPPEAVLLVRKPEDYYDEGEVVVDPFRIGRVEVLEQFTAPETDADRSLKKALRASLK